MSRRWRVHLDPAGLRPGARVDLPSVEAHHVQRVLRLRPGQRLSAFDGAGREWWATLIDVTDAAVTVEIDEEITAPVEAPIPVTLFQSWCEPVRMEWALQKGTELGLAALHPVCGRTSRGAASPNRLRRWRRIVAEACKQCGRRRLPRVEPLETFPDPDSGTLAILLDPSPGALPLGRLLEGVAPRPVWLAVGPAGGLSAETVGRLVAVGWRRGTLGPRILRAESAGLAAAAIVLHRWGDLGGASVPPAL
jgi:16S rRNA (uracil1498-N3)-methyltransferase